MLGAALNPDVSNEVYYGIGKLLSFMAKYNVIKDRQGFNHMGHISGITSGR